MKRPLAFTFPILTLCKGGAQRMLAEITNGLVQKGHKVTIIMPSQGEVEFNILAKLIKTDRIELAESDFPHGDVIVSNFYLTVPVAQAASLNGKGRHVRFSLCYEPMFLRDQHETFPTYNATPDLIVLSKYQQQLIEITHGIRGEIVPIGVNPNFRNDHIRNANSAITLSAVVRQPGEYSWHRNQDELIEALKLVKVNMPFVNIRLICPPNEFARSPELQALKNEGLFTFLTPADDVELNYHYNETDIFVSGSLFEAAALPALEAMKCGAAVVAIYSGGNHDYAVQEENCLISYAYQHKLFENIVRLIQDQSLRTFLAQKGQEEAGRWTWERSVNMFEENIFKFIEGEKV